MEAAALGRGEDEAAVEVRADAPDRPIRDADEGRPRDRQAVRASQLTPPVLMQQSLAFAELFPAKSGDILVVLCEALDCADALVKEVEGALARGMLSFFIVDGILVGVVLDEGAPGAARACQVCERAYVDVEENAEDELGGQMGERIRPHGFC